LLRLEYRKTRHWQHRTFHTLRDGLIEAENRLKAQTFNDDVLWFDSPRRLLRLSEDRACRTNILVPIASTASHSPLKKSSIEFDACKPASWTGPTLGHDAVDFANGRIHRRGHKKLQPWRKLMVPAEGIEPTAHVPPRSRDMGFQRFENPGTGDHHVLSTQMRKFREKKFRS
jgi:hypothetical protein